MSSRTLWIIAGIFLAIAIGSGVWYFVQVAQAPRPTQTVPGANPNLDSDGDGLTDQQESEIYHTDRLKPDTDGDGLKDGEEVLKYHTNPLNPDTDGDGYSDGVEVQTHHDPLVPAGK